MPQLNEISWLKFSVTMLSTIIIFMSFYNQNYTSSLKVKKFINILFYGTLI